VQPRLHALGVSGIVVLLVVGRHAMIDEGDGSAQARRAGAEIVRGCRMRPGRNAGASTLSPSRAAPWLGDRSNDPGPLRAADQCGTFTARDARRPGRRGASAGRPCERLVERAEPVIGSTIPSASSVRRSTRCRVTPRDAEIRRRCRGGGDQRLIDRGRSRHRPDGCVMGARRQQEGRHVRPGACVTEAHPRCGFSPLHRCEPLARRVEREHDGPQKTYTAGR
jgi:hypothetical protein